MLLCALLGIRGSLDTLKNILNVIVPLHAGVSHTKGDLGVLVHGSVLVLLSNLHGAVEVLSRSVKVTLGSQQLAQLHVGTGLTLAVFQLGAQFEVALNEHLKLVLVHLRVDLTTADLAQVSNSHGLASHRADLNGVPKGELMVDAGLLMVSETVVNDTQVDVGQELASHIGHLFMF